MVHTHLFIKANIYCAHRNEYIAYTHTSTCEHAYINTHTHTQKHIYTRTRGHIHKHTHSYIHTHLHTETHAHTYANRHTQTHPPADTDPHPHSHNSRTCSAVMILHHQTLQGHDPGCETSTVPCWHSSSGTHYQSWLMTLLALPQCFSLPFVANDTKALGRVTG